MRKRGAISVIINLALLPFGYYYLKQPRRFIVFLGLAVLLSPATAILHYLVFRATGPRPALGFLAAASIGWLVFLALDTWKAAGLPPHDSIWLRRPRAYAVVPAALALLLGLTFPASTAKQFFTNAHSVAASSGMAPTFLAGEYFFGTQIFDKNEIQRGQIIVYQERDSERLQLKRVFGLPGDRVSVQEIAEPGSLPPFFRARVYLNGEPVRQECAVPEPGEIPLERFFTTERLCVETLGDTRHQVRELPTPSPGTGQFAEVQLGPGQFYVLGDNRDGSHDSRVFGPVPAGAIREVYLYTILSLGYAPASPPEPADECEALPFRARCFFQSPGRYRLRPDRSGIRSP